MQRRESFGKMVSNGRVDPDSQGYRPFAKRPRAPWDPFFDWGNMARELWVKKASVPLLAVVELDELVDDDASFQCGIGGVSLLPLVIMCAEVCPKCDR